MIKRIIVTLLLILFMALSAGAQKLEPEGFTILLANDDGIDAPGLQALIASLRSVAQIVVAAPAFEQSGKGHSLTLREPIFVTERKQPDGKVWFAIEAPPASCVRLAVESLLPHRPDLVISGINRGDNLGITVYHAGTLGAAREAAIVGLPAIAVSVRGDDASDYKAAADFIRRLVSMLKEKQLIKPGLFLNVNVPAGGFKGVEWTTLSLKPRYDGFERRTSPNGRPYFWPIWKQLEDDLQGTDVHAFVRGFITITPMRLDVTAPEIDMKAFRSLSLN
jgi:5'-nucleotidase